MRSYCEGVLRTPLRRLLPPNPPGRKAQDGHAGQPRHDDAHHHAHPPTRSRSTSVQDEPGGPWRSELCWYWWSGRAGARVARGASSFLFLSSLHSPTSPSTHPLACDAGVVAAQVIELPLLNPELFLRVGIKPPKGVLLYGPPGTGKTLLARAVAATLNTNFLKVVSSAIVDKYIGESARVVREMFGYAREHEPCVIFMDEIDAIGGRRFSEGTSADREIQRTLMEVRPSLPLTLASRARLVW